MDRPIGSTSGEGAGAPGAGRFRRSGLRPAHIAVHLGSASLVALVLLSAGQPLFGDDVWWHLAMGEAHAAHGPWLQSDPFLFTAQGPPAPASWLADWALYLVQCRFGFQGLRGLHVLWVAGILGLVWWMARRASASSLFASLATAIFAALSAYRLFQLRPHLASMGAALLLVHLLLLGGRAPCWRRIALSSALLAVWANAHAGFVLGPLWLAAATAGLALQWGVQRPRDGVLAARVLRLTGALVCGFLATLANPSGPGAYLRALGSGGDTPALGLVADEWARVVLFRLPASHLPPTPLAWGLVWILLIASICFVVTAARALRSSRRSVTPPVLRVDPALVAVAAVSLVASLWAVRFLWLGFLPLLVLAQWLCAAAQQAPPRRGSPLLEGAARARATRAVAAVAALLLVPSFLYMGDWPMISNGIARAWYARPYAASKYYAHSVWFLRDAGLEGRLFNEYSNGAFLSYWLAPRLRMFVSGSLNVPARVLAHGQAIVSGADPETGESAAALLDRYGVDLFLGTGIPVVSASGRVVISTTTHLEGDPGWLPVFRNLRSAVYLRRGQRAPANLRRVSEYYRQAGVPFDPERGFDALEVMRRAPRWALAHGLLPEDFERLERIARSTDPALRAAGAERLASIYALAGLYERAIAIDRRRLGANPAALVAARRLLWCLLHADRMPEASQAADRLAALAGPGDGLSRGLVRAARLAASAPAPRRAAIVLGLPLFTRAQGRRALAGFREPEPRDARDG